MMVVTTHNFISKCQGLHFYKTHPTNDKGVPKSNIMLDVCILQTDFHDLSLHSEHRQHAWIS